MLLFFIALYRSQRQKWKVFCYFTIAKGSDKGIVRRAITSWEAMEESLFMLLQHWKNLHFDSESKSYFAFWGHQYHFRLLYVDRHTDIWKLALAILDFSLLLFQLSASKCCRSSPFESVIWIGSRLLIWIALHKSIDTRQH